MSNLEQPHNPEFTISQKEKVVLISIVCDNFEFHRSEDETYRSLEELKELLRTLKVEYHQEVFVQKKSKVDPATIIGSGKLKEICEVAKDHKCTTLVFDFQLSASQSRNIEEITKMKVVDRCNVIFQIFAEHAQTREAKIQIEISRLQYLLPRLTSLWTHFSRLKGGIGLKGEGEQQLELDRRIIKRKVSNYKAQLEEIRVSRQEQSKKRQHQAIIAALVGYTNVGKSSLMNRMCQVDVLEENKLFATLDATYRLLSPETKPPVLLVDTVGFISNLPAPLIEGFKSTFASAKEADLLLLVSDISDPHWQKNLDVTEKTLAEMGLTEKPKFYIFNKRDQIQNELLVKVQLRKFTHHYLVSTHDTEDMKNLRSEILEYFLSRQNHYDFFIPFEDGLSHAQIKKLTNVVTTSVHEKGLFYRVRTPEYIYQRLGLQHYQLSPEQAKSYV
jgi:GTP-binding protein HflX